MCSGLRKAGGRNPSSALICGFELFLGGAIQNHANLLERY
jgi:hypothetical protein